MYESNKYGLADKGKDGRYWAFSIYPSTKAGKLYHFKAYKVNYDKVLQAGFSSAGKILLFIATIGTGMAFVDPNLGTAKTSIKWQDYTTLTLEGDI